MSKRSGAGGYKGEIPPQFFASYPAALNVDEISKPQGISLYPGPDNQPPVLAQSTFNNEGRNRVFQSTVALSLTGSDKGSYYWPGPSGYQFVGNQGQATAVCPYGGGVGVTKHRVNIDFGQTVTLTSAVIRATSDFAGPQPGKFGTTTSLTSTTGTDILNANYGTEYVKPTFSPTSSRYWFLECNFPGAGCGGCGSSFSLRGVLTSDNIWLPLNVLPFKSTNAYKDLLDTRYYYFVNNDISTLNPDPWVTRQTTSTVYNCVRSPSALSLGGNGVVQISGIATDPGRPYISQTISGATSGATGIVRYVDDRAYDAYGDIAYTSTQSATIIYEPTSVANFTTGEKIYSIASSKPEPKLYFGSQPGWSSRAVLKVGSGIINGSGAAQAAIINNNDWYTRDARTYYSDPWQSSALTGNNIGSFTTVPSNQIDSNNFVFYTASGTIATSGILFKDVLFNTGSGYVDLDYRFGALFSGASLEVLKPVSYGSGGWY